MNAARRQPAAALALAAAVGPARVAARASTTVGATVGALAGLAAAATACPSCGFSLDSGTLLYVAAFMLVPYVVVTAVVFWVRRLLAGEASAAGAASQAGKQA